MSFIDTQLSRRVNMGFTGGPSWNTLVIPMASGADRRNADWSMPHHKYTADYTVLNSTDQNEIINAFMAARGQLHSFRFKDWNDFKGVGQALLVGDNTSNPQQLTKTYVFGASSYTRAITLPVSGSVTVTSNGSPLAVTIDYATGLVAPVVTWPLGEVIKATFEFDVRVRFGADFYPFDRNTKRDATVTVDLVEAITP